VKKQLLVTRLKKPLRRDREAEAFWYSPALEIL
jgi:hypothetical protein